MVDWVVDYSAGFDHQECCSVVHCRYPVPVTQGAAFQLAWKTRKSFVMLLGWNCWATLCSLACHQTRAMIHLPVVASEHVIIWKYLDRSWNAKHLPKLTNSFPSWSNYFVTLLCSFLFKSKNACIQSVQVTLTAMLISLLHKSCSLVQK